jgi:predicted anti-sigma-YlaC factor YlaD
MRFLTLRRDLVCREAVELVTDYLEGRMARRDAKRFEAHLANCDGCDEYIRQIRATIEILGNVQPEDLAPETRQGLMDLYRDFRAN